MCRGSRNAGCCRSCCQQECYLPCERFFIRSRDQYEQRVAECRPDIYVSATGDVSLTGTTPQNVVFGKPSVNRNDQYNTKTGVFTARCKGVYNVNVQIVVEDEVRILKNGEIVAVSPSGNAIQVNVKLCPGDLITVVTTATGVSPDIANLLVITKLL